MDTSTLERPHTIIWLDRAQARIFIKSPGKHHRAVVEAGHRGSAGGRVPVRHTGDNNRYFDAVMLALPEAGDILIIGPDGVKTEFAAYLKDNAAPIAERIRAVENSTAGSEGQMLARARAYFLNAGALAATAAGAAASHDAR